MTHLKLSELPLGKKPRGSLGIDYLSYYVCGEFVVAANGLILLENVDGISTFHKYLWIQRWVGALAANSPT